MPGLFLEFLFFVTIIYPFVWLDVRVQVQSASANCRCMCMSLCVCVCAYSYGCSRGCGWKIGCPTRKGERRPPRKKVNPQKTTDITAPTTITHRFRFGNPCKHGFLIQCEHGKSFHNEKCPKKREWPEKTYTFQNTFFPHGNLQKIPATRKQHKNELVFPSILPRPAVLGRVRTSIAAGGQFLRPKHFYSLKGYIHPECLKRVRIAAGKI